MFDLSGTGRPLDAGELERLRFEAALLHGLVAALQAGALEGAFALLDAALPRQNGAGHRYAGMPELTL